MPQILNSSSCTHHHIVKSLPNFINVVMTFGKSSHHFCININLQFLFLLQVLGFDVEMGGNGMLLPIISKVYCASSEAVLVVRKRPHVVNGGGFVVTDCSQNVVFRVDGCGTLGSQGELVVRDIHGHALLLIRRKGGMVEAVNIYRTWKGYTFDYQGSHKLVFSLKESNCILTRNNAIRISTEPRRSNKNWDFEIKGYFPDKACSIVDHLGNIAAQIGIKKEVNEVMGSKDLYHVVVKPGIDQAFVFGVIAVLDNIYGESTSC